MPSSRSATLAWIRISFVEGVREQGPGQCPLLCMCSLREPGELRRGLSIERHVQSSTTLAGHEPRIVLAAAEQAADCAQQRTEAEPEAAHGTRLGLDNRCRLFRARRELRLQAVSELRHQLRGDILYQAAPILGDRPRQLEI